MEDTKMKWRCKSCGTYFDELSDLSICPICNSKRIERISEGKRDFY
jgi:rubrerythrin